MLAVRSPSKDGRSSSISFPDAGNEKRSGNPVIQRGYLQRERLLDPPPDPQFNPNPVSGFDIPKIGREVAFRLKVSPDKAAGSLR
jgi:hypothetical protein